MFGGDYLVLRCNCAAWSRLADTDFAEKIPSWGQVGESYELRMWGPDCTYGVSIVMGVPP